MNALIFSNLRLLNYASKKFLLFIAFNVISWQCIVGPVLVLFARRLEMPPSWVGFLISFMPLSTLLVLVAGPLTTKLGPKKVMLGGWFLRNLLACIIFLTPVAIKLGALKWGWYILTAATLSFCIMRAFGASGWLPWLHEVVPNGQRGLYFSAESAITQLLNIVIMIVQALILKFTPDLTPYLTIYAIGILAGFTSLIWMWQVPGGQPIENHNAFQQTLKIYQDTIKNKEFIAFVGIASLSFMCTSWLSSASVMFMRDILKIPSNEIMILNALASVGIFLTVGAWGRFAEHRGSAKAMFKSLTGHSISAFLFLILAPNSRWTPLILGAAVVLTGIFGAAFWTATHRAMLGYMPESHRIGYSNIWTVGTALSLGITPIISGNIIENFGLNGFHFCFWISALLGIASALGCRMIVKEGSEIPWGLKEILNPILPVRTLVRIAWITLGLDESNSLKNFPTDPSSQKVTNSPICQPGLENGTRAPQLSNQ